MKENEPEESSENTTEAVVKRQLEKSLLKSKNMFIGNDMYGPYNWTLLSYDTKLNRNLRKLEDEEEEEEIMSNELSRISALALAGQSNEQKSSEEIYQENSKKERRKHLRNQVLQKLTTIRMNVGIKESDEYSCIKKQFQIKKDNEKELNKKNKTKGKKDKGKKRSILNSIIHDELLPNGDIRIDPEMLNPLESMATVEDLGINHIHDKEGVIVKSESKEASVNTFTGPLIKKSDNSLLSSNVLKNVSTLDLYKKIRKPKWHYPYKLYRVILGHTGWVNCVDVDISNEWFVTGSNDRLIKIWDLASCKLKLTLTGHINSIRDVKISKRNPYLFSCGEDNRVKCWDLEYNKVIRDYHGHLSGVYCLSLHPSMDILFSGGRDSVVRVWDIRTKTSIFVLSGHTGTIMSLLSQSVEPQVVSGSQDKMIRLWDLNNGKCRMVLTHHKKSIRSLSLHPFEYSFASCGADNVKVWNGSDAEFDRNISGFNSIINCSLIKQDTYFNDSSILILGSNNGQMHFYDWHSGYKYDTIINKIVPGSVECENSTIAMAFDKSETRLITTHGDKSIKIWKENEEATPENFPIKWNAYENFKF